MTESLIDRLAAIVGNAHVSTDPDVLDGRSVDHTGRYRGHAGVLVRPGSADEVAALAAYFGSLKPHEQRKTKGGKS